MSYDEGSYAPITYCPGLSSPLISGRLASGLFRYVRRVMGR